MYFLSIRLSFYLQTTPQARFAGQLPLRREALSKTLQLHKAPLDPNILTQGGLWGQPSIPV